ncbi:hypothetical protein ACQ4PT_001900 [Festuca glaucescens]
METTSVSIGKSVINGAVHYATSAIAEEVALQLGVQRDKAFVTDELEMMQSFLMVAHDERDNHSKVIKTWVKQVRDVAYDVEDGLQDFVVRVQKQKRSWRRFPRTFLNRRQVAMQMKELTTKVEEVSQRNMRYGGLIKGSSSTETAAATALGQSSTVAAAAMFAVDDYQNQARSELDLAQLIVDKEGLRSDQIGVIGVWQTNGTDWQTSIIWDAYENTSAKVHFPCRAWVRVTRPFHPKEFIHSIVKQFRTAVGVMTDALLELEEAKTLIQVAREYSGYVNGKRYLIVLTDLSTIEDWHQIKTFLPENNMGSRIVVSTEQLEVASICPGHGRMVSKLKQFSADQIVYAFYQQVLLQFYTHFFYSFTLLKINALIK